MGDWRSTADVHGWKRRGAAVEVQLGDRVQTVLVTEHGSHLELTSSIPTQPDAAGLVHLLEINRRLGLAWWQVSRGIAAATSHCPAWADDTLVELHLRDTAALADRYELGTSEFDL